MKSTKHAASLIIVAVVVVKKTAGGGVVPQVKLQQSQATREFKENGRTQKEWRRTNEFVAKKKKAVNDEEIDQSKI